MLWTRLQGLMCCWLAVQIIAINQDAARIPGFRVWNSSTAQVWKKPLAGGDVAVLMLNAANSGSQTVCAYQSS